MLPVFRLFALLCVAATIMNTFNSVVTNLLYAPQPSKSLAVFTKISHKGSTEDVFTASAMASTTSYTVSSNKDSLYRKKSLNASNKKVSSNKYKVPVDRSDMDLNVVDKKYPEVRYGGWYIPPNGTIRQKVAIIVPYRDRQQHLASFLNHMHPFLMEQQIEYGIFVIEQEGNSLFNRGRLLNVGFLESQDVIRWECFIFHDVDLLPLDRRNLYQCARQPRHLSAAVDTLYYSLQYFYLFGGVTALTPELFRKVNGYSNKYWGWGGEDNDFSLRLCKMGYNITRYNMSIARYTMLKHPKSSPSLKSLQSWSKARTAKTNFFKKDGLSSLKYKVTRITYHHLYTHIVANIDDESALTSGLQYIANMLFADKL